MEKVTLYSNGCPKCRVIESKLIAKNIQFEKSQDFSKLMEEGKQSLPFLEVDGELFDFVKANQWVNNKLVCAENCDNTECNICDGENIRKDV